MEERAKNETRETEQRRRENPGDCRQREEDACRGRKEREGEEEEEAERRTEKGNGKLRGDRGTF